MDFSLFVYLSSAILLAILLLEMLGCSCIPVSFECSKNEYSCDFFYGEENGPDIWYKNYPDARGCRQSPISIIGRNSTILSLSDPLNWQGYCNEPISMSLVNDGNTIKLFGYWTCSSRPILKGGPLQEPYAFHVAIFRWGPSNDEGSDHCLDYVRYALELQIVHVKCGINTPEDAVRGKLNDAFAIVTYFFQITDNDNPYLDVIITNLWRISSPDSSVSISSFPLEWLFPSFERKFYSYQGSLTQPPCSEIVIWIIQPQTIAISASQVSCFRKSCSTEGPILSNTRPIQKLNDRKVFYFS